LFAGWGTTQDMFVNLQVNFPKSDRIRKRWLLRRLLELACFSGLWLFMANQVSPLFPAVYSACAHDAWRLRLVCVAQRTSSSEQLRRPAFHP
jgi:hypothetical protein